MNTASLDRPALWTRLLNALGIAAIIAAALAMLFSGSHTANPAPLASGATTAPGPQPAAPVDTSQAPAPVASNPGIDLVASKRNTSQFMPITSRSGRTLRNHRPKSGGTVQRKTPKLKIRKSSAHTKPLVTH